MNTKTPVDLKITKKKFKIDLKNLENGPENLRKQILQMVLKTVKTVKTVKN